MFVWKRPKINKKEAGDDPLKNFTKDYLEEGQMTKQKNNDVVWCKSNIHNDSLRQGINCKQPCFKALSQHPKSQNNISTIKNTSYLANWRYNLSFKVGQIKENKTEPNAFVIINWLENS